MALKDLQKLKESLKKPTEKKFYRHLVVGDDLFALSTYQLLVEKYGESEVGLMAQKQIQREDMIPKGPSTLRGPANIEHFKKLYPEANLKLNEKKSSFYKEQKFREFGGRSKPETLLWGEDFYVDEAAEVELSQIFPYLNDEAFFKRINERAEVHLLKLVQKEEATDLIENAAWEIACTNGVSLTCEKLYWAYSPAFFLELARDKSGLPSELIQYCNETKTPSTLHIKFNFDQAVSERNETLFLPLSYTHEWGHFIGEFREVESSSKQEAEFVSFLVPEQSSEEEISKKIRILKKNLEKIFSENASIKAEESISLSEYSPCLKIDDSLLDQAAAGMQNLSFVSINGPLANIETDKESFEYSRIDLSHLTRGLENLEQLKGQLS